MKTCLPKYKFRILDQSGWNFREARYHEMHRRTLLKYQGIRVKLSCPPESKLKQDRRWQDPTVRSKKISKLEGRGFESRRRKGFYNRIPFNMEMQQCAAQLHVICCGRGNKICSIVYVRAGLSFE